MTIDWAVAGQLTVVLLIVCALLGVLWYAVVLDGDEAERAVQERLQRQADRHHAARAARFPTDVTIGECDADDVMPESISAYMARRNRAERDHWERVATARDAK